MKVAVLHNPRPEDGPPAVDDAFEEYDGPETIAAIVSALTATGVEAVPVVADARFPQTLTDSGFDFVFNLAEGVGRRCREAVPAAICEFLALPFSGSDALTLAVTLDKWMARRIVSPDVPVARAMLVECEADDEALDAFFYPAFVKPNDEGSSKGIRQESLCNDAVAARGRCRWLRERYNCPVLVEEFLPGTEVTTGVLGNGREASILGLMEIAPAVPSPNPFVYSLETKRDFRRQVRYHVPPRLPASVVDEISGHALLAYRLLGCRDFARLDFRLDSDGRPMFIECNPLPGLNPDTSDIVILSRSLPPSRARTYEQLVQGILHAAVRRYGLEVGSL